MKKRYKWIFEDWYDELLKIKAKRGIRFILIPYFFVTTSLFALPFLLFIQTIDDMDFVNDRENKSDEYRPTHYSKKWD